MRNYNVEIHTKNFYGVGKFIHHSKADTIVVAINEAIQILRSFDVNSEVTQIIAKKI